MSNRILNCTTCNDNTPITFVADDTLIPLYDGIPANYIIGLNSVGSIDDSFIYGNGFNSEVYTTVYQPDGKVIVGGAFTVYNDIGSSKIIRLNSDGSIDTEFFIGSGFDSNVISIVLQQDGKILVGGQFTYYNGTPANSIIRLNSDGSVDTSFFYGTGFDNQVRTIQVQTDGKILVGGYFLNYNLTSANFIIRLNNNGSVDTSFNYGLGFDFSVFTILLLDDGKIVVGGFFTSYNGISSNRIVRLNPNGLIDNTFIIGSGFDSVVYTVVKQLDGKILVGGSFTNYDSTSSQCIIRLNSNGSIDTSFDIGTGFNSGVFSICLQSDNKIVVGGAFTFYNQSTQKNIVRLNSDGSVDESFKTLTGFDGVVYNLSCKNDGSLLVGGSFNFFKRYQITNFIRLNTNGLYDGSFFYKVGFDGLVRTIKLQSDGKILVGGDFISYENLSYNRLVRINTDGSIDNSFIIGTGFDIFVNTIETQSDGKILVGGKFTNYSGTGVGSIVRLNTDGSIDDTFIIGSGFNATVNTIVLQTDGKILVGGYFTSYDGTPYNNIVRLNTDGSIDDTFIIGSGFSDQVKTIVLQPNGKILVGGDFKLYDSNDSTRIIRLNSDGSIDNTFVVGGGFDVVVTSIELQPDGKIIVGGEFTLYDNIPFSRIIRLNSDGTIDNTFSIGTGFDGLVRTINLQSDGKILVGGEFFQYNGINSIYFVRLNQDGSFDDTFNTGNGFDGYVYDIEVQTDDRILVGGNFNSYPLKSGVFQLQEGNCVSLDSYGIVSRNSPDKVITFGPFLSCNECSTPDDSSGVESIICLTCDNPESVTSTSVPHGIYLNNQGRAIAQINTVGLGGFNGLNN